MVPLHLSLLNFMCYRADGEGGGPLGLSLDGLHVVCLSGENGAGKSALLDAITWALWGEARTPDDDLIAQGESEMLVELTFELGEQRYRVARRRQRGGTGKRGGQAAGKTFLDLQVQDGAGWRAIGEAGVRETQARIEDLLRMSYNTFINASFLLQGRADEFTSRTPAERKQVLADILDLGEYAALEARARERARALGDQLIGLRARIAQLDESAAQLPFWADRVRDAELVVAEIVARVAQVEAEQALAEARLAALAAQAERRKGLLRELEALRAEQRARESEIAELGGRIAADAALVARRADILAGVAALAAAQAEIARLDGLRDQHDALSARQAELRQQFSEARGELRRALGQLEQRRDQLEQRAAQSAAILADVSALAEQSAALGPLAVERSARADERQALALRADQQGDLRRRHDRLDGLIRLRQDSLVAVREEQQRALRALDRQLADEPRWREELAAAQAAAAQGQADEARLAELRAQEQADVDAVSQLRAECARLKAAADKLKANQQILAESGGACPVCRSDLGQDGVAHVRAHYDEELAELRAGYAAAKAQADAGDLRLREGRAAAAALDQQLARLRAAAAQSGPLEGQIRQAEGWRAERAVAQQAHQSVAAQLAAGDFEPAAQAELAAVAAELAALGDPAELAQQRAMLDERLRELDARLQARGQIEGRLHARRDELERAQAELAAQPALLAEIAELRRTIDENDFAHAIRAQGKELGDALAALGYGPEAHAAAREQARDLGRWQAEERDLLLAEQRLAAEQRLLAQAEELRAARAADLDRLTREDALLEQELRALPQAQAAVALHADAIRAARARLLFAQNDLAEKTAYLKTAQAAADQLERERANEGAVAARQDLFAELGEALGKKGVQAMLIETAIPQIEDEANRLLGRMTDNQMHLSFEMQRDTKKGDTVETLEIKIADSLGTRVYDAFSGGEAMRANFAVRIALSRLLARRAGARLETLVIDEGFGSLDALGRERMVEAITGVQDDFRRIIVITHIDDLKDRFPAQIEVTKTPSGSRWELR